LNLRDEPVCALRAWTAGFQCPLKMCSLGGDARTFPLGRCVNATSQLFLVLTPVVTGAQTLKRIPLQGRRS
jgi:hypothetical protein